jgi:zinc protease
MKPLPTLLALLCLSVTSIATALAPPWPQDTSDLKADPKIAFGRLDNGLRYLIMPNEEPPGRASLRLYMDVGSLMEADDQQGMAHFLEHMAFNGTRTYPESEDMVEYFQHLGMSFGGDTNAHTSFRETVYQLELPKVEEKYFSDAIILFRDYLDGMLLEEKEINKERGIIKSEKLSRDSVEWRTMMEGFKFALPDALISSRMPIGIDETLDKMGRPRFLDFYETYYTPSRATVVVIGDIKDTAMVKRLIEQHFANAKLRRESSPEPDMGKITAGRGAIAKLHYEKDAPDTDISIETLRPAKIGPDTAARRREMMVRDLGDIMLSQRLSELAKKEGAPFISAESYSYEFLEFVEVIGAMVKCRPHLWKEAMSMIEQELRRAIEHGFTDAEFEEARAAMLKNAKLRAEQASTRQSKALASQFVTVLASKKVITHPAEDLKRVEAALATLKKEECHESFRKSWDSKDLQIFVGGNLKLDGDAEKTILSAYRESAAKPVAAPANEQSAQFAYTDFGAEGKISKREEVKDLEATLVTFENNVRLNVKKTPFQKNAATVTVSFGGGKLEVPKGKESLIAFAQSVFPSGGLEKHSADEIRRIFASKSVSTDFSVGDEAFLLAGRTTPTDLQAQLQLLAAFATAPGYREEAERQLRKNFDSIYTSLAHTAEGVMTGKVSGFIHADDPRFGFPERADLEKITTADLKAWLAKPLGESYLEIGIVGDVDVEAAIKAVANTFGALPKRAATKPEFTAERAVPFAKEKSAEFRFSTEIPKAIAAIYWPTEDMSDIKRTRRLILLSSILDDRLRIKVREELGETYSPACYHVASDSFTGYGYMTAMMELKPEQTAKIAALVKDIGNDLASGKISDDEFERAKKPQMEQLPQMRRDNRYWSQNVMRNCQENPERLEWARSLLDDFTSIKKADIEELAKKYLTSERAVTVSIIPEKK